MSGERRDQPEQEISIRRRGNELFVDDSAVATGPSRAFPEVLRETPPAPLSGAVKAALWAVSLVAALLFAAALWRLVNRPAPTAPRRPRAKSSARPQPRKAASATPPAPPLITTTPQQETRR